MHSQTSAAVKEADGLRDLILENRDATEKNRKIAEPVVEALNERRLGRLVLPAEYSGWGGASPREALEVYETLARAEASVAWIVWVNSLPCWFARFLSADARQEVFGGPAAVLASSTRPTGRARVEGDSYVVNGRWSLVSGCMHASWIPVMCLVEKDREVEMLAPDVPHMRMLFVPKEKHEIVDTWHVGGLRGTGSHDCVLTDISVPVGLSFAMGDPSLLDSPTGRVPIFGAMVSGCASICLGITATSLQAVLDLADKITVDGGPGLRDRAPIQLLIAKIDAKIRSFRDRPHSTCNRLWETAESGKERDPAEIGAVLATGITTAQECRAAVSELYAAAGTSALYTDSPLERAHRDIHAVTQHITLQPFWMEQAGRVQLGIKPTHPLFMI
jgi:alkylation response protein AidB-like acyl-CoA dehydrogenase